MNTTPCEPYPTVPRRRYSASRAIHPVEFRFSQPQIMTSQSPVWDRKAISFLAAPDFPERIISLVIGHPRYLKICLPGFAAQTPRPLRRYLLTRLAAPYRM
jgi:hypothetical protein